MTIEEMCQSKPWPGLCESMNQHPVWWVGGTLLFVVLAAVWSMVGDGRPRS
jgi:hypothetical protein